MKIDDNNSNIIRVSEMPDVPVHIDSTPSELKTIFHNQFQCEESEGEVNIKELEQRQSDDKIFLNKMPDSSKEVTKEYKNIRKEVINDYLNCKLKYQIENGERDPSNKVDLESFYNLEFQTISADLSKTENELKNYIKTNSVPSKNDFEKYNQYLKDIDTYNAKIKCQKFDKKVIKERYEEVSPPLHERVLNTAADILAEYAEEGETGLRFNASLSRGFGVNVEYKMKF